MFNKIINKKLIPIYIISGILGVIWLLLAGIPLFNSSLNYINSQVPENYKLPIALSFITIISLSLAFLAWKYVAPKLKEFNSMRYDTPSLAVVMSGSSGGGIFRRFKSITDMKFASVIKGMLFDVEKQQPEIFNEGAIHALRYPVQPAKSGFKGAISARKIEYKGAKEAFDKFFKPFAKKINSIVRITGIGRGYTSISTTTNFDFIDFTRFPGNQSTTLFDFIVVEKLNDDLDPMALIEQYTKKIPFYFNDPKFKNNIFNIVTDNDQDEKNVNNLIGVRYLNTEYIVTALDPLKKSGFLREFKVFDSNQKLIDSDIFLLDEENHVAILEAENTANRNGLTKSIPVIDLSAIGTESDNLFAVQHSESGINNYVKHKVKINSFNSDKGIIKLEVEKNANLSPGSIILNNQNNLVGIILGFNNNFGIAISSKKLEEKIENSTNRLNQRTIDSLLDNNSEFTVSDKLKDGDSND